MKKIILSTAVLLLSLLAHSQEANDLGNYAEVNVISRLDVNGDTFPNDSQSNFSLGSSSLYTYFTGSLSEHFSWTIINHWLQAGIDQSELYSYSNWLKYFFADFSYNNWTLSLGKNMITTGGFEFEEWDWNVHTSTTSSLWENLAASQWGAKVAYTTNSEKTNLSLQMTVSPYEEHSFRNGLWNYSFQWRGEYDWFSNIYSASLFQYGKSSYDVLVALGNRFALSNSSSFTVDIFKCFGAESFNNLTIGDSVQLTYLYEPSDKYSVALRAYYEQYDKMSDGSRPIIWKIGPSFEYYPINGSQDLRLHACVSYSNILSVPMLSFNIGARYNLSFNLF